MEELLTLDQLAAWAFGTPGGLILMFLALSGLLAWVGFALLFLFQVCRSKRTLEIDGTIGLLRLKWHRYPQLRLLQLLINASPPFDPAPGYYYLDDGQIARGLRGYHPPEGDLR